MLDGLAVALVTFTLAPPRLWQVTGLVITVSQSVMSIAAVGGLLLQNLSIMLDHDVRCLVDDSASMPLWVNAARTLHRGVTGPIRRHAAGDDAVAGRHTSLRPVPDRDAAH